MKDTPEFLLGGHDLEMLTIRDLLAAEAVRFHDHRLTWGAKASAYLPEIHAVLADDRCPVLIELENDLPPDLAARVEWIDHHGPRAGAGQPTSLHQVFARLGLPPARWTRRFDLVAANDRGHIRAMLALHPPATREELSAIRAADRAAQRCTCEDEAAARAAIAERETLARGRLTLLRLPTTRVSPAADLMEAALGGPGYENLLILSPSEVNLFGGGSLVRALTQAFPGGWFGGALPEYGFWGHAAVDAATVVSWLEQHLTA